MMASTRVRGSAVAAPATNALLAVLIAGVLAAWAPGYWAVSLLEIGIFALCALWLALTLRGKTEINVDWLYIPLALLAAWAPLQIAFHATVYPFETVTVSLNWLADFAIFALAAQLLRARHLRERFLDTLVYFGFGLIVISILQSFTSPRQVFWLFESEYRVIGPFVYKNQFAAFVEILLPIALYRMLTNRKQALLFGFMGATMFAAVVMSASRTGTVILALEILFALVAGWGRGLVTPKTALLLFVQMFVLLGVCTAVVGWEALGEHFQDQTSGAIRHNLFTSTVAMIRDRPWFGWGFGNWKIVYPAYANFDNGQFANAAHCDWAQWAAEGGLLFTAVFGFVFARSLLLSWRCLWGAGTFFVLIHSFFDYPAREPVIAALVFAMLGAMCAGTDETRRKRAPGTPAPRKAVG